MSEDSCGAYAAELRELKRRVENVEAVTYGNGHEGLRQTQGRVARLESSEKDRKVQALQDRKARWGFWAAIISTMIASLGSIASNLLGQG